MERPLARYFNQRGGAPGAQFAQWSRQAIALSEAALAHAWALRRLAERYSAEQAGELSADDQRQLDALVRAHCARRRAGVHELRGLIEARLSSVVAGEAETAAQPESATWQSVALLAFAEMNQINQLLRGLLAGARWPHELLGAQATRPLLTAPQQLERRLQNLAPT